MTDLANPEPQEFHYGTALSNVVPHKKSCYLRSLNLLVMKGIMKNL
jgi:hypothetical protein